MKKSSILILNRWHDDFSLYEKYIDHSQYNVFYIATSKGALAVNTKIAGGLCVLDEIDIDNINKHALAFMKQIKRIDKIVALSEVDQEIAAYLRSILFIPGLKEGQVKKFRDKIIMKNVARKANILVPDYIDLESKRFISFLDQAKFPIILKPKSGVSSEGIYKTNDKYELKRVIKNINIAEYECEEFVGGKIFHADGLIFKNNLIFFKVSEYINTCYDYTLGKPLGSIIVDDVQFGERAIKFTKNVLNAFDLSSGAFHLEFILDKNDNLFFMELGARVGGAKVPSLFHKLFDINLIKLWIDIQLGKEISFLNKETLIEVGGWLLFPEPRKIPSQVVAIKSLQKNNSAIIEETLPSIGHIFTGNGEYRDTCGAYLFRGKSTREVRAAIYQTIEDFFIKTGPIIQENKDVTHYAERQAPSSLYNAR